MNIERYLSRIGYKCQPAADLKTLQELHISHLRTVPFENLDIHANQETVLSEELLYEKIVGRRRGGICYELNGAFAWLLRSIGFDVTVLAANVHVGGTDLTPDFDHMALVININERRYLADVGFGDSFLVPLDLEQRHLQSDGVSEYKISLSDGFYTLYRVDASNPDLSLSPLFRFQMISRSLEDFAERNNFHQQSSASHFRRKVVCSRADSKGRITLSDSELIITEGKARVVTPLPTPERVKTALHEHFGITQ